MRIGQIHIDKVEVWLIEKMSAIFSIKHRQSSSSRKNKEFIRIVLQQEVGHVASILPRYSGYYNTWFLCNRVQTDRLIYVKNNVVRNYLHSFEVFKIELLIKISVRCLFIRLNRFYGWN